MGLDVLGAKPVACTFIEYQGPISQKVIVNRQYADRGSDHTIIFSDISRSIFARRVAPGDTRSFPPITTDQEVIVELRPTGTGSASGRLRLVSYLQPLDPLYFEAARRSVAISDYSLELQRLSELTPQ